MKTILLVLLFAGLSFGQCQLTGSFTGQGSSAPFDNRLLQCSAWQMNYSTVTITGFQMFVEGSPDNSTWTTIQGAPTNPVYQLSPNTPITTFTNAAPSFLRLRVKPFTGSGSITFILNGQPPAQPNYPYSISITDYGASTSKLDNTDAYNRTIAALPSNGGTITVPPGIWYGHWTLPAYPKTLHLLGAGNLATLFSPPYLTGQNTPVFDAAPTTPNYVSGDHHLEGFSILSHHLGSNGPAIMWTTLQRTSWDHIGYFTNGTGNFHSLIYCWDGSGDGIHQCYNNSADFVTITEQSGPAIVLDVEGDSAQNSFSHWNVVANTGITTVWNFANSGANTNTLSNSICEGNLGATCLAPGSENTFISDYYEGNGSAGNGPDIVGNGGGANTFIAQKNAVITCPNSESAWVIINSITTTKPTGCVNASIQQGAFTNLVTLTSTGGITTSTVSSPGITMSVQANVMTGLAAGTYQWIVTSKNSAGESVSTPVSITITSGQAPAVAIFVPSNNINGAAQYNVYGRNCSSSPCGFLFSVANVGSNGVGFPINDDGTTSPTMVGPPTRNTTGDINITGGTGGTGATASRINTSGPTNYALDVGTVAHLPIVTIGDVGGFVPQAWPFADGWMLTIKMAVALQAGVNTITVDGNSLIPIRSAANPANNIGTATVGGAVLMFVYNAASNCFELIGQ